jgi:hypothetical protein
MDCSCVLVTIGTIIRASSNLVLIGATTWFVAGDKQAQLAASVAAATRDMEALQSGNTILHEEAEEVRKQLAASHELAAKLKGQVASHSVSLDEVVGYFFHVYTMANFVAADRDR